MRTVNLTEIRHKSLKLRFKEDFQIDICKDEKNKTYYCDIPQFEIFGTGLSEDEVLLDIKEGFIMSWKTYVQCDISELSLNSIELRRKLIESIEEVKYNMEKIIKCTVIADKIKQEIKEKLQNPKFRNISKPTLVVISYDNNEASKVYIRQKQRACDEIGINMVKLELKQDKDQQYLINIINNLNMNMGITGIIVQLPLPNGFETEKILERISPRKDVDGFTSTNIGKLSLGLDCLKPCTPKGIIRILEEIGYDDLHDLNAVVIGRSNIVGKPIAQMLIQKNATVTICHTKSGSTNIRKHTKNADIIIAAAGSPKLLDKSYLDLNYKRPIIIDVGIHRTDNGLVGDVDFDNVLNYVYKITPVPGGVGPMTVAMLMENIYEAYETQANLLWKYNQDCVINNIEYSKKDKSMD